MLGFLPVVGNFANLGCAVHAYQHGETWHGHQKLAEAVVGISLDLATMGSTTNGLKVAQAGITHANTALLAIGCNMVAKDVAVRTATRVGAFGVLHYVMDPFYHKY